MEPLNKFVPLEALLRSLCKIGRANVGEIDRLREENAALKQQLKVDPDAVATLQAKLDQQKAAYTALQESRVKHLKLLKEVMRDEKVMQLSQELNTVTDCYLKLREELQLMMNRFAKIDVEYRKSREEESFAGYEEAEKKTEDGKPKLEDERQETED